MEIDIGEIILEEELEFEDIELDTIKEYPPLINLEVAPTNEEQVFNHEGEYGYDKVKVKAVTGETLNIVPSKEIQKYSGIYTEVNVDKIETEELNIIPTTEEQSFEGLYEKVTAHPVTSEIDSNIIPENIAEGKTILGVEGNFKGKKYAPKFISFYKTDQEDLSEELANLDISNIKDMTYCFSSSSYLKNINWTNQYAPNLERVTYFANENRYNLKTVDLSNWYVPNLTACAYMFHYDRNLTSVIMKGWETPKLTRTTGMFSMCDKVKFIDIRDMTFDNVTVATDYQYMFSSSYHSNTEIIVKDETQKAWLLERFDFLTNVKTLAEYQAEGGV